MAACDTPSSTCRDTRPANNAVPVNSDGASGVAIMAATATSPINTRAPRAPQRSAKMPTGIWNTA